MAIVVESTATNSVSSASSITVTKPTGVAVGDLLIFVGTLSDAGGETISTESGWTLLNSYQTLTTTNINVQYKVADSGDVSASNYTFDATGTCDFLVASIMRVSGYATNDLFGSVENVSEAAASSTTISLATNRTPPEDGALFIIAFVVDGGDPASSISAYTASDGNISWTELHDDSANIGSTDPVCAAAYGIQPTATNVTSFGGTIADTKQDHAGWLVFLRPEVNDSVTLGTVNLNLSTQPLSLTGDANVTLGTITLNASQQAITPATPDPDWTNKDKSANSTFTNKNKS